MELCPTLKVNNIPSYLSTKHRKNIVTLNKERIKVYHKRFRATKEILEQYVANIRSHPRFILIKYQKDRQNNTAINTIYYNLTLLKKYGNIVKKRTISFAFIRGAKRKTRTKVLPECAGENPNPQLSRSCAKLANLPPRESIHHHSMRSQAYS